MLQLSDYILVVKNAISSDFCDLILTEYKEHEWVRATTVGQDTAHGENTYRKCWSLSLTNEDTVMKNPNTRKYIDTKFYKEVASGCIDTYRDRFPSCRLMQDSGYDLLMYKEGGYYRSHTDNCPEIPRTVSCSVALNDNYQGGEFSFFDGELTYSLEKGDALLFPSTFQYDHEIKPVIQGTRYSVITWFT